MIARKRAAVVLAIGLLAGCGTTTAGPTGPTVDWAGEAPDVVIVVLDAFSGGPLPGKDSNGHCQYSGVWANDVGSGGGGDGLPPDVSHGKAVYDTVRDELNRAGRANLAHLGPQSPINGAVMMDKWLYTDNQGKQKELALLGVDTAGYDTDMITNTIGALRRQRPGTKLVLNMSFLILPCNLAQFYNAHQGKDMLGAYLDLIKSRPELNCLRTELESHSTPITEDVFLNDKGLACVRTFVLVNFFLNQLYEEIQVKGFDGSLLQGLLDDPLRRYLKEGQATDVVAVGAAGNGFFPPGNKPRVQLGFPMAPGIWNSVVSVSSAGTDNANIADSNRAPYSNSGEVMMAADNSHNAWGTSFAAPHLSALEALYLLNGGLESCDSHVPPLGYADIDKQVYTWNNLTLGMGPPNYTNVPLVGQALDMCNPKFATLAK